MIRKFLINSYTCVLRDDIQLNESIISSRSKIRLIYRMSYGLSILYEDKLKLEISTYKDIPSKCSKPMYFINMKYNIDNEVPKSIEFPTTLYSNYGVREFDSFGDGVYIALEFWLL